MSPAAAAPSGTMPLPARWGRTEGSTPPRVVREGSGEVGLRLPLAQLRVWWNITQRGDQQQAAPLDLALAFRQLADEWREATADIASAHRTVGHPAYLRIIALGKPMLPHILRDLRESGGLWFPALTAISGREMGTREERQSYARMVELWLEWGRSENLL